jgi:H2-forming N5,N10-methylenetetrahydromethanopterin dehydrogenase-like enzyme
MTRVLGPAKGNIILRVEVGSTAHGTGLPGLEDHDETLIRARSARAKSRWTSSFRVSTRSTTT